MAKTDAQAQQEAVVDAMSDVFKIRDILFGRNMEEYNHRFTEHEERMTTAQAAIEAQMQALDDRTAENFRQTQAEMKRQFQELRADTERWLAELRSAVTARLDQLAYEKTTRFDLASMLIQMGEQLKRDGK
ncbi:MAG: hypothetical protein K1X65_09315 [Caldilineales bacterium]|nr:hypothetical protein [Caldilineales bacterium]MCW5859392.1 hypothetical protein [Caldilineales bacterium]